MAHDCKAMVRVEIKEKKCKRLVGVVAVKIRKALKTKGQILQRIRDSSDEINR